MDYLMKDYLFHAVSRLDTEKSLNKIFDTGYILTRDSLKISLTPYEYKNICLNHGANWNGMNSVSISCHPDNYDIVKKYNLKEDDFDNAYSSFIIGLTVLVLNPALLDEFDIKKSSCKMNYELQILGDIPIKYVKAVALDLTKTSYSSQELFALRRVLKELNNNTHGKDFKNYYTDTWYLRNDFERQNGEERFPEKLEKLYRIKRLIEAKNIDIPIVDINYGYELPSYEKMKKRYDSLSKQYIKYKEKKSTFK